MRPQGIIEFAGNWIKGSYRFGKTLTDSITARMDLSPKGQRYGASAFDALAGGGITYIFGLGTASTALGAVSAMAAVATAPVHAAITVPVAAVFLLLQGSMTAMGIGMLAAAKDRVGIPPVQAKYKMQLAKYYAGEGVRSAGLGLKFGAKKLAAPFKKAASVAKKSIPKQNKPKPAGPKGGSVNL
jgi:hypothetical protein